MNLGFVITTLGRVEGLRRLLVSLDGRLQPADRVIIIAQRNLENVHNLVAEFAANGMSVHVTTSERGASRGRNVGVAAMPEGNFLLTFPNDTTWFPPGAVERLRTLDEEFRWGAVTVADEYGPKLVIPSALTALDRWNVWQVPEVGLLVRRSEFERLGGFDPSIGTGASSPWQAGEATDLLLRAMSQGGMGPFIWCADVTFAGVAESRSLTAAERRRKLRRYGRGLGYVMRRWRYPLWWQAAVCAAGLLFGLRHGEQYSALDGGWVFLGRLEGLTGRILGSGEETAVDR